MAEFRPIAWHIATLVHDCMRRDSQLFGKDDFWLPGHGDVYGLIALEAQKAITDAFDAGFKEVRISSAKGQLDSKLHIVITARRDFKKDEWYGLALDSHGSAKDLLRELAKPLTVPWSYGTTGAPWVVAAFTVACGGASIAILTGLILGTDADALWLITAELVATATVIVPLLFFPKDLWERRVRRLEDALAAMSP